MVSYRTHSDWPEVRVEEEGDTIVEEWCGIQDLAETKGDIRSCWKCYRHHIVQLNNWGVWVAIDK